MSEQLESTTSSQLMLFAEGSRARTFPLPEKGRDLLESGLDYGASLHGLLTNLSRSGWLSKMSLVFYPATEDEILPPSFDGWRNGGMAWHGGYLTLNISELPNDAEGCSLSEVLETDAHPKYYLSAKACAGILRRAEKRGKTLPTQLEQTLRIVATKATAE